MRTKTSRARHSRRQFLKRLACTGLSMVGAGHVLAACTPATGSAPDKDKSRATSQQTTDRTRDDAPSTYVLPAADGSWTLSTPHRGDLPQGTGTLELPDKRRIRFDAGDVKTLRPDIFQEGHISLFDVLAHLGEKDDIDLVYHWDDELHTHVIDEIDGQRTWWYEAWYSSGWPEQNVFRMDTYPFKNNTRIRMLPTTSDRLGRIYATFRAEAQRLARNGGQVILPDLTIRSPAGNWAFTSVLVEPHDVRLDLFKPGVVTALDALISLAERGELSDLRLTWYERIASAKPVDSYWVSQVNEAVASGGCGFVYETGPREFSNFRGSHIHIPADARVTISPEYALWFWICL